MTFRNLFVLACIISIGFAYNSGDVLASEPSVYTKILTPSPLGEDRVLVVCSFEKSDGSILKKLYAGMMWHEFLERDLTLVEISESIVSTVLGGNFRDGSAMINAARHHDYGDALRKKADCKNDLEFVLIGKDTGVKARWMDDFTQEKLFSRIDAMPMRRYEIRQRMDKN